MTYYQAPFTFNFTTQKILVDQNVVNVDCGDLYNIIKLAQSSNEGILYEQIAEGSGLNNLGSGVQVGITVKLLGSWQLQFPTGNYVATIAGGNFIGGPDGDPVAYSEGVQTLIIQSAASTVVTTGGSALTPEESAKLDQIAKDTKTTIALSA